MKLKIIYRKDLDMSSKEIAIQACHAVIGLGITDPEIPIVVLGQSDKRYQDLIFEIDNKEIDLYEVFDKDFLGFLPETNTCFAYLEK